MKDSWELRSLKGFACSRLTVVVNVVSRPGMTVLASSGPSAASRCRSERDANEMTGRGNSVHWLKAEAGLGCRRDKMAPMC